MNNILHYIESIIRNKEVKIFFDNLFEVIVLLFIFFIVRKGLFKIIDKISARFTENKRLNKDSKLRIITLIKLFQSWSTVLLFVILVIILLQDVFHINTNPFVAGLSIIGVAISLSAKEVIMDFISGIAILLENQYSVGDYIFINETLQGKVINIGFRITKLEDGNGRYVYIRNGLIEYVKNNNSKKYKVFFDVKILNENNNKHDIDVIKIRIEDILNTLNTNVQKKGKKIIYKVVRSDVVKPDSVSILCVVYASYDDIDNGMSYVMKVMSKQFDGCEVSIRK